MKTIVPGKGKSVAIFQVTGRGDVIARNLESGLSAGATIFTPEMIRKSGLRALVKDAFYECGALVFICAAGIAVRTIAPYVQDKTKDPAVIVIDDSGRFAVSLLSGHLGGANALAIKAAAAIGATPVITTATDNAGKPCAEDIAKVFSFAIENSAMIKKVNSAILRGDSVIVIDEDAKRREAIKKTFGKGEAFIFKGSFSGVFKRTDVFVYISPFMGRLPDNFSKRTLVMRPKEFVIGIGCNRGVELAEVNSAVNAILKKSGIASASLRNVATIDVKSDEAAILSFATRNNLRVQLFSAKELNKIVPPSGASKAALKAVGVNSVCEAAAMLSAGVNKIWTKKTILGRVTAALTRAGFTS